MLKKIFFISVFLILFFYGCGSSSSTGPEEILLPDNPAGNDYITVFDTLDTAAVNSDFDDNYPDTYSDIFENWLNYPKIFSLIYDAMKDDVTYNSTEDRWEAEVDDPENPTDIIIYGEFIGDIFRVYGPGFESDKGLFIYPDGGIYIFMIAGTDDIKLEIYKESGYYYGFARLNKGNDPYIVKFKYEDKTLCEDFQLYIGIYGGSSTVENYQLIRDRPCSAEDWFIDESNLLKIFEMSWDGSVFDYEFYQIMVP